MELKVGDRVEVTRPDRQHECVYVGQRGTVLAVTAATARIHLRCGHVWDIAVAGLRKLGDEEPLRPVKEAPVVDVEEEDEDWRYDTSDE